MPRPRILSLETLEDRLTPTVTAIPMTDPTLLTAGLTSTTITPTPVVSPTPVSVPATTPLTPITPVVAMPMPTPATPPIVMPITPVNPPPITPPIPVTPPSNPPPVTVSVPPAPITTGGLLTQTAPVNVQGLVIPYATVIQLNVTSMAAMGGTGASAFKVSLYDANGIKVYEATASTGQSLSATLTLPKGNYTMAVIGGMADGSALSGIGFNASACFFVGPPLLDPDAPIIPAPVQQPAWMTQGFFSQIKFVDPYGRPLPLDGWAPGIIPPIIVPPKP